jgi:hypothetical protein
LNIKSHNRYYRTWPGRPGEGPAAPIRSRRAGIASDRTSARRVPDSSEERVPISSELNRHLDRVPGPQPRRNAEDCIRSATSVSPAIPRAVAALRIQLVELTAGVARPMEFQSGSDRPPSQSRPGDRKAGWGNGLESGRRVWGGIACVTNLRRQHAARQKSSRWPGNPRAPLGGDLRESDRGMMPQR